MALELFLQDFPSLGPSLSGGRRVTRSVGASITNTIRDGLVADSDGPVWTAFFVCLSRILILYIKTRNVWHIRNALLP